MNFTADIPNPLPPGTPVLPHLWQIWPQDVYTPVMAGYIEFHRLVICVLGVVFFTFLVLMGVILYRFSARRHPKPHKAGGPYLQFAWVGLPVVLLVLIAIPALRLQAYVTHPPKAEVSVSVIGRDGGWIYVYPKDGDFSYESRMLDKDEAKAEHQPYGFAVDAPLIVPVGRTVDVAITSMDVMHSWSVPMLGVRGAAIPGMITHVWFRAEKPGLYYGLCSSLCGARAQEMPVAVRVVPDAAYRGWLSWALHHYLHDGEAVDEAGDAS